jgi:hypothetical protein
MSFASQGLNPTLNPATNANHQDAAGKRRWLTVQVTVAFLVSAAAAIALWSYPLRKMHPDPSFPGRLHQAMIPLIAFGIGVIGVLWWTIGLARLRRLKQAKTAQDRKNVPVWLRWVLAVGGAAALSISIGRELLKFLWPGHASQIQMAADAVLFLLPIAGAIWSARGKTVRVKVSGSGEIGAEPKQVRIPVGWALALTQLVAVLLLIGFGYAAVKFHFPHKMLIVGLGSAIALGTMLVGILLFSRGDEDKVLPAAHEDAEGNLTREGFRHRMRTGLLLLVFFLPLLIIPLALPLAHHSPQHAKVLLWVFPAQIVLLVLAAVAVAVLQQRVYRMGHRGETERALRLDQKCKWVPFYPAWLRGSILFSAARYREAREYLKPLAFDAHGNARLDSRELYLYTLCLTNDGREEEAQPLLEAVVDAQPENTTLTVALATCLLAQEKDPGRACALLEQSMKSSFGLGAADRARRVGRYAWALASAGKRAEAEKQIEEALAAGAKLAPEDLAGVQYFVGEAWRALKQTSRARAAFDQAIALRPDGVTARSSQKALKKMGWYTWSVGSEGTA